MKLSIPNRHKGKKLFMEQWKTIKDYEGLYEVSNIGRVKSLKYGKEKILKSYIANTGYLVVTLCKNNESKHFMVHRLVAFAFVDGWFEGAEIDHIDTNRENNIWTNLRWVTHRGNMNNELTLQHKSEAQKGRIVSEETKQKISESHKAKQLSDEHKRNISESLSGENNPMYGRQHTEETKNKMSENHADYNGSKNPKAKKIYCVELDKVFDTIKECAEELNINYTNIINVCRGRQKTAGGYHFIYYEDYLNIA